MSTGKLKNLNKGAFAILWVMISAIVLGGVTYAWFTFSTSTNIKPMAGAIGRGGAELLISNSYDGNYGESTQLVFNGLLDNMQPTSTSDLIKFFASVAQDSSGISNKFKDITEDKDKYLVSGAVYLMSKGGNCDVYLNKEDFTLGDDGQFLASARLGFKFSNSSGETSTLIMKLDSLGATGGAEAKDTMSERDVVISDIGGDGAAVTVQDPSKDISTYFAVTNGDSVARGEEKLCTILEDEKVQVDYYLYIEGCDENTINSLQDKGYDIRLSFAGLDPDNE